MAKGSSSSPAQPTYRQSYAGAGAATSAPGRGTEDKVPAIQHTSLAQALDLQAAYMGHEGMGCGHSSPEKNLPERNTHKSVHDHHDHTCQSYSSRFMPFSLYTCTTSTGRYASKRLGFCMVPRWQQGTQVIGLLREHIGVTHYACGPCQQV